MRMFDIIDKITPRDSEVYFDYAKQWIEFVTSKKSSIDIPDKEWQKFFGQENPAAGINRGALKDEDKDRNGKIIIRNEQKSFKDNWDSIIRPKIEDAINTSEEAEKIVKIKELYQLIHKIITEGGGRNTETAINRMLTVFFPDLFVTIPKPDKLIEFINLLNSKVDKEYTIIESDNWIDNSYQVKKFFDNELHDDNLTASAWRFYDYLKGDKQKDSNVTNEDTKATTSMDKNKYDDFQKLLLGNYNLILTGAPGTGKTYLAKEIAKSMGAKYKLVQFHPSYDYTDFVEGLRPIKEGNTLGFQRKDGVFKKFCKDALKYGNQNIDDAFKAFHSDLSKGRITIKSHKKSNTEFEVELGDKNYKIFPHSDNCPIVGYDCAIEAVKKYIETGEYNEGHQTYQPSIGEYIKATYMKKVFVFIIDEINRGEASKIFGELFYAIDPGYRGEKGKVDTQYQNLIPKEGDADFDPNKADVFRNGFYVPENVYIIGTMNDIDRSVESMDFAMRRRFAWKEITAKSRQSMLDEDETWGSSKPSEEVIAEMKARMDNLNAAIIDEYGSQTLSNKEKIGLTKAYQIGAAYFLKYALYNNFEDLWNNHLEGLLREYLRGKPNIDEKIKRLYKAYIYTTEH